MYHEFLVKKSIELKKCIHIIMLDRDQSNCSSYSFLDSINNFMSNVSYCNKLLPYKPLTLSKSCGQLSMSSGSDSIARGQTITGGQCAGGSKRSRG